MSVFQDFQKEWAHRFPGSELPSAWEDDVRANLSKHQAKVAQLKDELEKEEFYVQYLAKLLQDAESQRTHPLTSGVGVPKTKEPKVGHYAVPKQNPELVKEGDRPVEAVRRATVGSRPTPNDKNYVTVIEVNAADIDNEDENPTEESLTRRSNSVSNDHHIKKKVPPKPPPKYYRSSSTSTFHKPTAPLRQLQTLPNLAEASSKNFDFKSVKEGKKEPLDSISDVKGSIDSLESVEDDAFAPPKEPIVDESEKTEKEEPVPEESDKTEEKLGDGIYDTVAPDEQDYNDTMKSGCSLDYSDTFKSNESSSQDFGTFKSGGSSASHEFDTFKSGGSSSHDFDTFRSGGSSSHEFEGETMKSQSSVFSGRSASGTSTTDTDGGPTGSPVPAEEGNYVNIDFFIQR